MSYEDREDVFGLPRGVLDAVIAQESGGDTFAIRYEPIFFVRYIGGRPPKDLGGVWPTGVSHETERRARAMSWGLMQIMGQTARELGYTGAFLSHLCEPNLGVHYGALLLAKKLAKYGNLEDALSAYNAGSPTDANRLKYVQPIITRMGVTNAPEVGRQ